MNILQIRLAGPVGKQYTNEPRLYHQYYPLQGSIAIAGRIGDLVKVSHVVLY